MDISIMIVRSFYLPIMSHHIAYTRITKSMLHPDDLKKGSMRKGRESLMGKDSIRDT